MTPADSLDSLSKSIGHSNNWIWLLILSGIILCIVLLFIFRKKPIESEPSKLSQTGNAEKRERDTQNLYNTKGESERIQTQGEQTLTINNTLEKGQGQKSKPNEVAPETPPKVEPPKQEQLQTQEPSSQKYIGYTPVNSFEQTEPLKFPIVVMPKPNCIIKFPQKGKTGRKGYKEERFKSYLSRYFTNSFELYDDRFILTKSNTAYEPDFTLIDEKNGVNIFLDIEIDEPYEGINDISKRKATHYRDADTNRNNAFKSRGWIVIRFAEIQVHQSPDSCCLFIARVISSIYPKFQIPEALMGKKTLSPIPQWTLEDAKTMSRKRFREQYLEIPCFHETAQNQQIIAIETEFGKATEALVKDEEPIDIQADTKQVSYRNQNVIRIVNEVEGVFDNGDNVNPEVIDLPPKAEETNEEIKPQRPPETARSYLVLDGSQRENLLEHIGMRVVVVGRIGGHYKGLANNGDPYLFVNIGSFPRHTLTIVLWNSILLLFQESEIDPTSLEGQYVSVIGKLDVYHDEYMGLFTPRPQIELKTLSQLQILAGEDEAQAILDYRTAPAFPEVQPPVPKQPTKEEYFLDDKIVTPPPVKPPLKINTTSDESTNKRQSQNSLQSKKDGGCLTMIVGAIIGGLILGVPSEGEAAFIGIIIGGWIGSKFSD